MLEQGNDVKFHPRDMDETYKHMLPPKLHTQETTLLQLIYG